MKQRICIAMLAFLFCGISNLGAQDIHGVSGKVTDAMGELPGVSVMVKGTTTGTVTAIDGSYSLDNLKDKDVLVFSFLGYKIQEIVVGKQKQIDVTLVDDSQALDEAVVVSVGYGDVRRRDLTGSIGKAKMSDITKLPVNNVAEALGGRIAGVNVTSSDGGPGDNFSIVVRGASSLTGSTAPLYVIDGFPQEASSMASLNPNDIESIDVLKDASATAIYGARGANGVVIINTKKGSSGRPTITYNASYTNGTVKNTPEVMNGYEFVMLQQEILPAEEFATNYITELYPDVDAYKAAQSYDWQDYIYRNAHSHNHHLSMSGTSGGTKYAVSLSYAGQQGVVINSGVKRYQGRVNLSQKVTDRLKVDMSANYASTIQDGPTISTATTAMSSAYMYSVWAFRPVSPTGTDLLNTMYDEGVNMAEDYRFNPVLSARNEYRHKTTNTLSANISAEYELIKGLKLKVTGGYSSRDYKNEEFNGSMTSSGNSHPSNTRSKGINAMLAETETRSYLNENTLSYQLSKRKHNFSALVGLSFQKTTSYAHSITAEQISNESFGMAGLDKGSAVPTVTSSKGENTLMSYFGRVNYNYDSRYYVTFTMRADGSSKFSPENRWGYFPSGSVAWAFGREKFIKNNLPWWSNGKLRASYGMTGNNRIGNYEWLAHLVTDADYYKYPWDSSFHQGYVLSSMSNLKLKWETTEQFDLGLDLGFLKDRINISMDYYIKTTRDLLLAADIAASSGFATATLNVGRLRNAGFELTLETVNIKKPNFSWTSNFNIAFNDNRIVALNSGQDYMTSYVNWDNKYKTMPAYMSKVGESAGKMYGFIYEGTYKYEDFDTSVDDNGKTVYKLKEGIPYYVANTQPGDPKYRDVHPDGVINDDDKTIIGNGQPLHTGGFTNNFVWKNFDLNIFMQWSYGNDILNANRLVFENPGGKKNTNMFRSFTNRWSPENPDSNMPSAYANGTAVYSSYYVEDGSFLKLRNITLGYTFPKKMLRRIKISNARVYVAAENIGTLTNYSGADPEVSTRNSVLTPGFDWSAYPRAFNISVGLNVTF